MEGTTLYYHEFARGASAGIVPLAYPSFRKSANCIGVKEIEPQRTQRKKMKEAPDGRKNKTLGGLCYAKASATSAVNKGLA